MIRVVVDSACDIADIRLVYDKNNQLVQFAKASLTIRIGEKEYKDDEHLDVKEMIDAMKSYEGPSSTACPSPGDYLECFKGADEIYVVTITSSLSGSYNSAMVAKKMELEDYPEKKIHVIDTLSTGPEMDLIIQKILYEIQQGHEFEKICENVAAYQNRTKLTFVLHSVDNLVKNGRVSKLAGFAANLLGITVVGRASSQGELEMITKGRGGNKTNASVVQEMKLQGYQGGPCIITHCFNEKDAKQLRERLWKEFPGAQISIMETRGLCSFYVETGGLIVGYETVEREFSLENSLETVMASFEKEKVPSKA